MKLEMHPDHPGTPRLAVEIANSVGRMHGIEDTIWFLDSTTLAEELAGIFLCHEAELEEIRSTVATPLRRYLDDLKDGGHEGTATWHDAKAALSLLEVADQ